MAEARTRIPPLKSLRKPLKEADPSKFPLKPTERAARNTGHARARYNARVLVPIIGDCAFVLSDQHYDAAEKEPSPAHRAALKLARQMKPFAIVNNGDTIDAAGISKHDPIEYTDLAHRTSVVDELTYSSKRLYDFEKLGFVRWLTWNLGNHDARFEGFLARHVPEYAGVSGFRLKDHFPNWLPAWRSDFVHPAAAEYDVPEVIVKHRFKGGQYAANNNTLWSGTNIVTGHDHMLWAKALSDVRGTRWGMDAGTLARVDSHHFLSYTEDNTQNWQSGFLILHFRDGRFTGPELVHALEDGRVLFRGDVLKV